MQRVRLYWSNICVLHKHEKAMLNALAEELEKEGIALEVRHFGIGYPMRMSEYMSMPDAELPDIIVSTDLEVFEHKGVFDKIRGDLYPLTERFKVKASIAKSHVNRMPQMLPFLVIPLVYCAQGSAAQVPPSLIDCIKSDEKLAFGGINNSAGKSVVKAVWAHFGKDAAQQLLENASVTDMPIQAFQRVKTHQSKLALTPALYARRADGVSMSAHYPKGGAVAVPSYISARKTLPLEVVCRVLDGLLTEAFCNFYVETGDMICCLEGTKGHAWSEAHGKALLYPDAQWLEGKEAEDFYALYQSYLPQAHRFG